ncbi:uncharacterized protein PITG_21907 [Phytophthora infestans T30-4]|uniref:Stealth protein CR4 conserved region 4 domain-containing protein n=1 Tax=Phytophthora infestans (strain T30-4) TaxID=403677 RepID=D0P4Q1_PHYIT|nr:uncharacterized protein PITG_21907 [Phytophthora infestans T30-4]EEY68715.1 conserved hypothetical protein [Phytophthora infestans T30-4]|eukprot:XP_002996902.1 conserved hypothetical protein [Phytophthora infestans T30-4]
MPEKREKVREIPTVEGTLRLSETLTPYITLENLERCPSFAWKQMMGTRARRTKFVCINDDMKNPSTAVSQILHELFLSIWPKRSQFELPYHLKNRYAHIDEFTAAQERRHVAAAIEDIARARAASASQLTQDFQHTQEDKEDKVDESASPTSKWRSRKASA